MLNEYAVLDEVLNDKATYIGGKRWLACLDAMDDTKETTGEQGVKSSSYPPNRESTTLVKLEWRRL